jgi:NAD(P)-dependent dehydrogenase (short-subunit alcohol dehydrogenase family)
VICLTQAMAQELGAHGITVNASAPAASTRAGANRPHGASARSQSASALSLPPTGRIARPDDVARLALFFASEQNDHITGQAWNVDGGTVMH